MTERCPMVMPMGNWEQKVFYKFFHNWNFEISWPFVLLVTVVSQHPWWCKISELEHSTSSVDGPVRHRWIKMFKVISFWMTVELGLGFLCFLNWWLTKYLLHADQDTCWNFQLLLVLINRLYSVSVLVGDVYLLTAIWLEECNGRWLYKDHAQERD